jgi:prepilin peptidase CpaA
MPFPEIAKWAVAALFTAMLAWAAISDVRTRRIPNWTVLAIIALFVPWALLHWGPWAAWALAAGAIALAFGIGLYAMGIVGAGDAKLFAAAALFTGLERLLAFSVATALAGGVIALLTLAARPHRAMTMFILRGKGEFGGGVPYGVAISLAGAAVVWAGLLRLVMLDGIAL